MALHEQLPIPTSIPEAARATEVARVWIAGGRQHFTLLPGAWDDQGAWGILLVDLARHIAFATAPRGTEDQEQVLRRIRAAFDAEWENPTDRPN